MSVFGGDYASYYDLFYADKDYAAEAAFGKDIIFGHNIEFGCGARATRSNSRVQAFRSRASIVAPT